MTSPARMSDSARVPHASAVPGVHHTTICRRPRMAGGDVTNPCTELAARKSPTYPASIAAGVRRTWRPQRAMPAVPAAPAASGTRRPQRAMPAVPAAPAASGTRRPMPAAPAVPGTPRNVTGSRPFRMAAPRPKSPGRRAPARSRRAPPRCRPPPDGNGSRWSPS